MVYQNLIVANFLKEVGWQHLRIWGGTSPYKGPCLGFWKRVEAFCDCEVSFTVLDHVLDVHSSRLWISLTKLQEHLLVADIHFVYCFLSVFVDIASYVKEYQQIFIVKYSYHLMSRLSSIIFIHLYLCFQLVPPCWESEIINLLL